MKKIIACILAPLLIVLLPTALFAAAGDTVFVKSFGLMPNTRENAVKIIQTALDSCRTKKNPILFFEKGRYDFWPQYSIEKEYFESNTTEINPKRCPIWIYGFNNLTIDANGSDFIYHDRVQPFTIDQSQDITIKNVQIDWDIPLTAQASVKDTSTHYIDLQIDSTAYPFIIEKGKLFFTGEGWKSQWWGCMEFEKSSHMIAPQTGDDGVLGNKWEQYTAIQLSANTIRLNYNFTRKPAIGNILVMRHNERDHAGIFITQSKNIRLANIYLFQTAGLGILAQYSENLDYSNIQVVPNAAKGRYFSGHDDGCHFSNCKGQILIDHCSFTGLMDDPINVHGTAVQIIEKKSATELLCRFMHEQSIGMVWAQAGDTVGFINHTSMQTKTYGIVASFTALNTTDFIIRFIENIADGIAVKDALENISWTPHITIRNSVFGVNRARGILISTPGRVIVEDNIFESSGSAILIAGDANQWFETGAVKDVLIQRNVFKDACLTSMYQFCEAIISIDPEIPVIDKNTPFHRNIVITNNQFNPYDYPVLYAKSVEGLTFSNNTITRSNRFTPFHPNKNMFSLLACKKVTIANNQLNGNVLGKNILLQKMTIKDISIQPAKSLAVEQR
ncbi:alpha-1,3-galactosidase-related protein [Limnovirga soli]|uniref:Alpha-1,3-galactosidase B n=1 Tax=Limnovirga soli TaxID=2656915 RepID=A0A8J8JQL8_9BACT|nr:right-handed parallel beta-helix repeat-containing protein [Limnovirga soli]NNV54872.1 alpha-1,3-galactosidase B [Limnovirga soli]